MSLTAALYSARTGLNATQQQIGGVSDNIANALTPGYVAREARLTSLIAAGAGRGVAADIVRGPINSFLLRDIRYEAATFAGLDYSAAALSQIAQVTGEPADGRSIASAFDAFEASFQTLFNSPEDPITQRGALQAAQDLVGAFQRAQDGVQDGREKADRDIALAVAEANTALQKIADLNDDIKAQASGDGEIANLLDERDRQIDQLSELIGIRTFTRDSGEIVITTREGVTLLDGDARTLDFTPTGAVPPDLLLGGGLSGLTVDGADITPTGGGAQAAGSGRIAGAFAVRDDALVTYQAQIDELALQTITMFEAVDASALAPGQGLFIDTGAPGPAEGLAGRLGVNPLVDPAAGGELRRLRDGVQTAIPGSAGDTTQIQAFLDGFNAAQAFAPGPGLSTSTTLGGYAGEIASGHLINASSAATEADASALQFTTMEQRRISENGVNIDEESQRLLELQEAYAANAQVISTVARMFDELLASVR